MAGNNIRSANLFIERSIKSALDFFKDAVFSDDIARGRGLLQLIDPRIKIALLFILLIITCFAKTISALAALYIFSIILAVLSGVNLIFFLKRVWFFIPIFTLLIAIPAVFMQGALAASAFVLRVTTCVSFAVLLTITTRHSSLLKALKSFGVPAIFVAVLDMTYRYIFLLLEIFEDMHTSLKARLIEKLSLRRGRYWVSSRIAFLFRRSLKMSEDVYMAMLARGYSIEGRKNDK